MNRPVIDSIVLTTTYKISGAKAKQDATIMFQNGEFKGCHYHVENITYTLDDWKFILLLAQTIEALVRVEKERHDAATKAGVWK